MNEIKIGDVITGHPDGLLTVIATSDNLTMRDEFEAAYRTHMEEATGLNTTAENIRRLRDGDTYGGRTYMNGCWWGWQAAMKTKQGD